MTENALAIIEKKNAAQYFAPKGLDPIIQRIREEVTGIVPDISTDKGRKEIASLAYKVAKSKTALDQMGKELVSGIKEQAKAIDAERSRAWDALEAIQKEVRAPLTEWEEREKARIAELESALAAITEHPGYGQHETADEISKRLAYLESYPARDWWEFEAKAEKTLADEIERTKLLMAAAQKREAEQAELERLRREEAERKQREHEERIAAEAAAKAKAEAELAAKREAEKANQERQRIELEKQQAEERAAKAEADRIAAEEKARADAKAAAEKAKRDVELAVQREREHIEAAAKAEAEATAKREADRAHRAKINNEAKAAILKVGAILDAEDRAKAVVEAIAQGKIPHVTIRY